MAIAPVALTSLPDPSLVSSDYNLQIDFWNMVNALIAGEAAIKQTRTNTTSGGFVSPYLPKFDGESNGAYAYRLINAPYTNVYDDISKNLASKPFAKECTLVDETPQKYKDLAENIDGQGNNLNVFASALYKSAQDKGIAWILVEHKKVEINKPSLTIAEAKAMKLRPYWINVAAEDMLAVYSDFVDGVEVIYHARIWETVKVVNNNFSETVVERVRAIIRDRIMSKDGLTLVGYGKPRWELWESYVSGASTLWKIIDEGTYSVDVIPLVPVTLNKRPSGSWVVTPPLRNLAYMQVSEFHQEANLTWVTISTCFPMIAISGLENPGDANIQVGPNKVFVIPQNAAGTGPAGDVKIVEPSASSIVECRNQLELTRKEMRDLGMQPLTTANLTVITTANVSKKASSAVQAWALLFKDALEMAWRITAQYSGESIEPEVFIHTDFAIEDVDAGKNMDFMLSAERQGIYSKQTVREQAKRVNVVVNDIDDKEEEQRLAEQNEGLEPEQPIDPRTGQPIVVQEEEEAA